MQSDLALKRYLKKGLSSLYSRVISLFDTVKNYYYQCAMDNMHNSVAFCKATCNYDKKALTHSVTQLSSRGISPCIC